VDEGDGFENRCPTASKPSNPKDIQNDDAGGAPRNSALCEENSAVAVLSGSVAPDLARVILAWPSLPDESKAAVLALVAAHEASTAGRVRT